MREAAGGPLGKGFLKMIESRFTQAMIEDNCLPGPTLVQQMVLGDECPKVAARIDFLYGPCPGEGWELCSGGLTPEGHEIWARWFGESDWPVIASKEFVDSGAIELLPWKLREIDRLQAQHLVVFIREA